MNQYGELCPQQDKALEELGFELPNPEKKRSKTNNRKVVFDSACRTMFLDNHIIAVMIHIVCHLNLVKRKIILFSPVCHCGISLIAVPVNILTDNVPRYL